MVQSNVLPEEMAMSHPRSHSACARAPFRVLRLIFRPTLVTPFLFLLFVLPDTSLAQTATFQGIGDLPGGLFWSLATDISPDGSIVVGRGLDTTDTGLYVAVMWTESGGLVALDEGSLSIKRSLARGVSADGEVIVGQFDPVSSFSPLPFRWTSATGMVALVDSAAGLEYGQAFDVSADGEYIVGVGHATSTPNQAFRWNAMTGVDWLGWLPSSLFDSFAFGVSADGSAVCGISFSGNEFGVEVFRWTESGGMVGLGDVPGGHFYAIPHCISGDGTSIVGQTRVDSSLEEIFIWRQGSGYILPDTAHGYSIATGTTFDGSLTTANMIDSASSPVLWDEVNGFRDFVDIVTNEFGLDMSGWTNVSIAAVSDDGTAFAGNGTNPDGNREGWFARLPLATAVTDPVPGPKRRFSVKIAGANPFGSRSLLWLNTEDDLSNVRAGIYRVDGRLVQVLFDGASFPAGRHLLTWDGRDSRGRRAPSGVYFLRVWADGEVVTKKLVSLR